HALRSFAGSAVGARGIPAPLARARPGLVIGRARARRDCMLARRTCNGLIPRIIVARARHSAGLG
ncbi:MAG TPA: hypothetical protein VKH19_13560, partial [Gemmatimonadaceae bacterium]|nr:hypothetical protein [Gemmatimonadaceae bacterium]